MPAPTPIQIRYGDNGLLGQAAAAAGAGRAWNQRKAMDMDFLTRELDRRQRAEELDAARVFEANQLQQAQQMQMERIQASQQPQIDNFYRMSAPTITDPSSAMKMMSLETAKAAGVAGPELAILEGAANNKNINAAYFESMADEIKTRSAATASKKKDVSEKQAYFNSLGNTLPPEDMANLKALSESEDMNIAQFRTAVSDSKNRAAVAAKQNEMMQKAQVAIAVQGVDDKINQLQAELKTMEKDAQDEREKSIEGRTRFGIGEGQSYDESRAAAQAATPAGTSEADFSPKEEPGSAIGRALMSLPGNPFGANQMGELLGGKPTTSGGDPMGLERFKAIARKKRELQALQQERQNLASQIGMTFAPTVAAAPKPDPLGIR